MGAFEAWYRQLVFQSDQGSSQHHSTTNWVPYLSHTSLTPLPYEITRNGEEIVCPLVAYHGWIYFTYFCSRCHGSDKIDQ